MGYERENAPATPTPRYYADSSDPKAQALLTKAKAYHGITAPGMPAEWAFDQTGNLINRATGGQVTTAAPFSAPGSSFLGQLAHAAPYFAGAEAMGLAGAFGPLAAGGGSGAGAGGAAFAPSATAAEAAGGGAGAAGAGSAALGPSTAASMAETSAIAGGSGVPASLAATTGAGMALDPITLGLFAAGEVGNVLGASAQAKASKEVAAMNNAAAMDRLRAQLAYEQSVQDPFRQQMMQMGDLSRLDMLARAQQSQFVPQGPSKGTGRYAPQQYLPSEDVMNWAALMRSNVASGKNVAPDVTNQQNYGKYSALDLNALLAGTGDPRTAVGATNPPAPPGTAVRRPVPRYQF